jgi:hypothetical protein
MVLAVAAAEASVGLLDPPRGLPEVAHDSLRRNRPLERLRQLGSFARSPSYPAVPRFPRERPPRPQDAALGVSLVGCLGPAAAALLAVEAFREVASGQKP